MNRARHHSLASLKSLALGGSEVTPFTGLQLTQRQTSDCAAYQAQGGVPDALFELGLMYCAGRDVDLDMVEAHKWFNLAALRGNEAAKQYRQDVARELSKAQVGVAQKRAREWLSKR